MIKTYCDGCHDEIRGYHPGRYRVEIKELAPGQLLATLHVCSVACLRAAVEQVTSSVNFARREMPASG